MKLDELVAQLPPERRVAEARRLVRRRMRTSGQVLAVLDDDPTGTQVVHGVDVYTVWPDSALDTAFAGDETAFFLSTNSRSMPGEAARTVAAETTRALRAAARRGKRDLVIASRSDSTLRGHYVEETEGIAAGWGVQPDGIIVVPAFFEGGRYTVGDVHWAVQGDAVVPAHETESAQDPVFGFTTAHLPSWVAEKTAGRVRAADVMCISIEDLREGGPDNVCGRLLGVRDAQPVVVNAASYADLEVFVLGLIQAEQAGKRFVYRCAASFVKARAGFDDRPLLGPGDLSTAGRAGLVVAGSYVGRTSRQLERLLALDGTSGIEVHVARLLDGSENRNEVRRVLAGIHEAVDQGKTPVIYTSRQRVTMRGDAFLDVGTAVMEALCRIVQDVDRPLGYLIAKGGITSHALARDALGATRARVSGQAAPGVPVWLLGPESRRPGLTYVVFPGNVGDDGTLADVYLKFSA